MQALSYNPGMKSEDLGGRFAADVKGLAELKASARKDPQNGLRVAAQQFEALFTQMMLKSMRDASPKDGLFDSDQSRFFTSMLDQQLAQNLSGKSSTGLARMIEAQLRRGLPTEAADAATQAISEPLLRPPIAAPTGRSFSPVQAPLVAPATSSAASPVVPQAASSVAATASSGSTEAENAARQAFVERIWPHAVAASNETGIPAHFLVGHAALESGWGRHEIRRADGSPSFNIFGVKAGRRWSGDAVEAVTTEYANGVAGQTQERFRAYRSYAESFRDYAGLLKGNPRFAPVLGVTDGTEFARQLQQGGYATDPMYADKLSRILSGATLRRALQG
jgi:flagellar protein FlgJ